VQKTRDAIMQMMSSNNPMSFDDVYEKLNYVHFDAVKRAFDRLLDEGDIHGETIELKSASGHTYKVRIYNNINFPVQ
jgi:predicted ArsR family transcriptional regulator